MRNGKQPESKTVAEGVARLDSVLDRFAGRRVLVVGDLMLDDYRAGDVERISPEAPVPVVRVREERTELGGAGNVVRGLVALGADGRLVAAAGEDPEGARVVELLAEIGLSGADIVRTPSRATPHKMRVIARGQQMLRIDREDETALAPEDLAALRSTILAQLSETDVVVLQDYDKGIFRDGLAAWLIDAARKSEVPIVADPKHDLYRFHGASLIKPNAEEARRFLPGLPDDFAGRRTMLEKMQRELGGSEIVLTRGAAGMTALDRDGLVTDVGTEAAEVFDVQGAGDTSIAALALCRASGASLVDACIVANAAAAIAVGKMGTAAVGIEELRERLPSAVAAFLTTSAADSQDEGIS